MKQTTKERHAAQADWERARQAHFESMLNYPQRRTSSMDMPPFPYTVLCPDPRYRPGGELYGKVIMRRDADGQGDTGPVLRDERGNQRLTAADQ